MRAGVGGVNTGATLSKHAILPLQAQGQLGRTDLVGKDEGHPGPVAGVLGDVANELQHGRNPWDGSGRDTASSSPSPSSTRDPRSAAPNSLP